MAYRAGRRAAVPAPARARSQVETFPAPTRGLVTNQNLASGDSGSAWICDNWIPTETGMRLRGGSAKYATVGGTLNVVESIFTYNAPDGSRKMFAGCDDGVYEITAVADPDAAVSASISGRTSARYHTAQIGTTGGDYLVIMNGADAPLLYDGSTLAALSSTFSITFSDSTTTSDLIYPFVHQNRLWFIKGGSLDVYYMPVQSVGGAASLLTLKSVAQKGGYLLFGASWSVDSGIGADDRAVFITSEGEALIFTGSDPSAVYTWNLIGRYDVGKPLGRESWMRVGGDLIIGTEDGAIPLSQVIQRDPSQLELSAVSRPIEPDWRAQYNARNDTPWPVIKWQAKGIGVIGLPHSSSEGLVVNLETGGWGRITGWDIQSAAVFGDRAFFGTSGGLVLEMESGGLDNGASYLSRLQLNASHLGLPGSDKVVRSVRATYRSLAPVEVQVSVAMDYSEAFPSAPGAATSDSTAALWGTAIWGESLWGDDGTGGVVDTQPTESTGWVSVTGVGAAASVQVQVTSGDVRRPDCEIILLELMYELGDYVG